MVTTIKKITRIGIYSALLGIVGLFASLFSRDKQEYHINLNPFNLHSLGETAHAETGDGASDGSDGSSSDGGGGSDM
ncbi:MAG: hypothetical protein Q8R30_05805 [bacterium]|nr:hypothetical protein [bacterium]MDZ4260492.1 hypothetical protein [Candidatus Sungbacteria bacterium]